MPLTVPSTWQPIGSTINTRYFMAAPDLMIVWPHVGSTDDGASAKENLEFQRDHAQKAGCRFGYVIVLSTLTSQDTNARKIYAEGMTTDWSLGVALVVENPLSRAIASFFAGLTKPKVPTRIVNSVDAGLTWLKESKLKDAP